MELLKDNRNTHLSKVFSGIVWRICIDEENDLVALEIRNQEIKTTTFSCIDLKKRKITFNELKLEENWFCGIETISSGVLLLHYYVGETTPEHKGMLAYDAFNGTKLWENYSLTYDGDTVGCFKAFNPKFEPRKNVFLNKFTGEEIKNLIAGDSPMFQNRSVKMPFEIPIEQIPQQIGDKCDVISAEYLTIDKKSIYSVYLQDNQFITSSVYVFDDGDIPIWEDKMRTGIQKTGFDTFFVYKNYLMYLKNQTEFVCYFL
ncbi:DUF4905 domain-containing protein [Solitalea lacus]|uniref:DUF4905 domain-containing protein n=1 Tax=Solitalea lacus TaxID=2911172 RepID=UPI001EDBB9FF|nr:DUF4905 domain-containing protein [Solitalea lacus]UKJ05988.1 DUF4905 domain-containing protein [Solitalea lacus]